MIYDLRQAKKGSYQWCGRGSHWMIAKKLDVAHLEALETKST